jgi:hypothetical protein
MELPLILLGRGAGGDDINKPRCISL